MTVELIKLAEKHKTGIADLLTRSTARKLYKSACSKIDNAGEDEVVIIDFSGIGVVDPSFADEFLIKLKDIADNKHIYLRLRNLGKSAEKNIMSVIESYSKYTGKNYAFAVENITSDNRHCLGRISENASLILDYLSINRSADIKTISMHTGLSINESSAHADELLKSGLVKGNVPGTLFSIII